MTEEQISGKIAHLQIRFDDFDKAVSELELGKELENREGYVRAKDVDARIDDLMKNKKC